MTREEAIKIMQLNKGRMNGSVQAALGVLLPELDAPQQTVLTWRTCKAGDRFGMQALIRYPAYAEIGWYAKGDGEWVPMSEIEHPLLLLQRQLKALEQEAIAEGRTCKTCAYYSARTRWEGRCQRHGSTASLPPDDTCELWHPYDMGGVEKKSCFNCLRVVKCDAGAEAAASGETHVCANWTSKMEGQDNG